MMTENTTGTTGTTGMNTDGCGDPGTVQGMAVELFQLASLLVGNEPQALALIETSVATMEIDPCLDPAAARSQTRTRVVRDGLAQLITDQPSAFAADAQVAGGAGAGDPCIQDDDLQAAGVTPSELRSWVDGQARPELQRGLRTWLESLPIAQRAIFVQRAVLGQGNEAAAALLREAGAGKTQSWTAEQVSGLFRQALCSLANSLAHAPRFEASSEALPA